MSDTETLHHRAVTALQRAAELHNLTYLNAAEHAAKLHEEAKSEQPPASTPAG